MKRQVDLNEAGRCSIHVFRPEVCRLFPLGRYYKNHAMYYFLQKKECKKEKLGKIKVHKWIDTPNLIQNEQFAIQWHDFLNKCEQLICEKKEDTVSKKTNLVLLTTFYFTPYQKEDFYPQFYNRLKEAKEKIEW